MESSEADSVSSLQVRVLLLFFFGKLVVARLSLPILSVRVNVQLFSNGLALYVTSSRRLPLSMHSRSKEHGIESRKPDFMSACFSQCLSSAVSSVGEVSAFRSAVWRVSLRFGLWGLCCPERSLTTSREPDTSGRWCSLQRCDHDS